MLGLKLIHVSKRDLGNMPYFVALANIWQEINDDLECSVLTQIASFTGPTWGSLGSCRPQVGPMLAPWTLLSGLWKQKGWDELTVRLDSWFYHTTSDILNVLLHAGPHFNIKTVFSMYMDSHYKDEMVVIPSYLYTWYCYTGKTVALYWDGPQVLLMFY